MIRHWSETPLAILTLAGTATHFILETWYHVLWGQPLEALIIDYIWVALMVLGGVRSLVVRPASAAGLLAAGWAFALGFGWRSVFGRLEHINAGKSFDNGEPQYVVYIILCALVVVGFALLWSLWLTWNQRIENK